MDRPDQIAMFVLRTATSSLSVIGSLMVMSQIVRSKYNRGKPQQRLVLGMVSGSFLGAVMVLFGTFLVPPSPTTDVFHPLGNFASCQAQGFLMQLGSVNGIIHTASLQLHYLLVVRFDWREHQICRIEPLLHAVPLSLGFGTAVASFPLKLYNPAEWNCWIARLPHNCTSSFAIRHGYDTELSETDCVRGDNAAVYRLAFFYAPLWISYVFCICAMFSVYTAVRGKEVKSRAYAARFAKKKSELPRLSMTEAVAKQSLLYSGTFLLSWIFPTIVRCVQISGQDVPQVLVVLAGATGSATEGFFNSLIYFAPRYVDWHVSICCNGSFAKLIPPSRYKKCNHRHWWQKVWSLMRGTLFFCCKADDITDDRNDCVDPSETPSNITWRKVALFMRQMTGQSKLHGVSQEVMKHEVSANDDDVRDEGKAMRSLNGEESSGMHPQIDMHHREEEKVEEEFGLEKKASIP